MGEVKELIENMKLSPVDMERQIKELKTILSNSLEIASKVRKYCEERNDFEKAKTVEELGVYRRQIDELRKKVLGQAELNLKTELTDLYHLQINLRMKNALLTPSLQLDKISFMLKLAEEQNLIHDSIYLSLKNRFESKNQKSKEVNQLKQIEHLLNIEASKDNTPNLIVLANYRRSVVLTDPADLKIKNSYIEELV